MSKITDPHYLRTSQYKDSNNLSSRANLHKDFGTNPLPWQQWLREKIQLPEKANILELGSGPGYFWTETANTIPAGWRIILTDISGGMLEESRGVLKAKNQITHVINDAQEICCRFFDKR